MPDALRYLGQALAYGLIALAFGSFADWPAYTRFPADRAQLTLSLVHSGQHKVECRRRSAAEIAKLPPNMRRPLDCPRERLPVLVALELDGEVLVSRSLPPSGLFGDGPSQVYANFTIPTGRHRLVARLRDSARAEGYDYERAADIELSARQRLVVEFKSEAGGFQWSGAPAAAAPALARNVGSRR